MTKSILIKLFIYSFFVGVAFASIFDWKVVLLLFVVLSFLVLLYVWRLCISKKIILVFLFGFLIGVLRFFMTVPSFDVENIAFYRGIDERVKFIGRIVSDPEIRNNSQYFTLEASTILYEREISVSGRILIKVWRYPEYEYGDIVEIYGVLERPAEFDEFSYGDFLAKDSVYTVMYNPLVKLKEKMYGIDLWSFVFGVKTYVNEGIEELFESPGDSIVLGLLLGMRATIPDEILNNFQRSGLTHILAISGYNITLLITIFGLMMKSRSRRLRFVITTIAIVFFALLTGLSASVVRASIMGALLVFLVYQGRKTDGIIILLFSGFLMVFVNPRILIWDVSFQLSFVSTFGLMVLMPLLEGAVKRFPVFIGEGLVVTLAATVFTTPVVLYHFGTFSFISPLANVLFLPLIPLIMFFSFLAFISSLVFPFISFLFVGICWIFLFILIEGVDIVASIPYAFVKIESFPIWALILYYFLVWRAVIFFRKPRLVQGC